MKKVRQHKLRVDFFTVLLAFIGALIALGGSLIVLIDQAQTSGSSVWPLPALVLIDWAILGVRGFLDIYIGRKPFPAFWPRVVWFDAGALMPLYLFLFLCSSFLYRQS